MDVEQTDQAPKRAESGFTLIELLTAMMVIAVLAALTMGVVRYAKYAAKRAHAKAEIEELHKVLHNHQLDNGKFPNALVDVRSKLQEGFLVTNEVEGVSGTFFILDPWFNPYHYNLISAASFELYSEGPKTGIADDDIYSGK